MHYLLTALLSQAPVVQIDRVVAVVDKEVLTESEFYAEARVLLALHGGERGSQTEPDAEYLASTLGYLVEQLLISAQARRLGGAEVSEQDVDKALKRFIGGFRTEASYQAFLRRLDVPTARLRDVLRRELRNARYVNDRMGARLASKGGQAPSRDDHRAAYERWIAELKSRSEIRLLGPTGALELQ